MKALDSLYFRLHSLNYTYSDKLEDMGNSKDYKEFFIAFKYLVRNYIEFFGVAEM